MKFIKFIGRTIASVTTDLISGVAEDVVEAAGVIAQNATTKVMNLSTEIQKGISEKDGIKSKTYEEKLLKLKTLFDSGIITQEEFENEKAIVLGKWL